MYAFYIDGNEVKIFMNRLLREDTFDGFEIRTVELENVVKYSIDGKINNKYLADDEIRDYCYWAELRKNVFDLIKGARSPEMFKIVLSLTKDKVEALHSNGSAMFLNVMFENGKVNFVTGTAQRNFSLDKGVDIAWEDYIKGFFKDLGIPVCEF